MRRARALALPAALVATMVALPAADGAPTGSWPPEARTDLRVPRGALQGTLRPSGTLAFLVDGKALSVVKTGYYEVDLVDSSRTRGIVLASQNARAILATGSSFVGTRTGVVRLKPGKWTFSSTGSGSRIAASRISFTVTA
jgi:hypothetical protein